jgi:hypothetical protein
VVVAACALAFSQALLILPFTKGALAWETVISTASSGAGARRAPRTGRRVRRPPRARPAPSTSPPPQRSLRLSHRPTLHLSPHLDRPLAKPRPPGHLAVAFLLPRRHVQPRNLSRTAAQSSPPQVRLAPAPTRSSGICHTPACAARGVAG